MVSVYLFSCKDMWNFLGKRLQLSNGNRPQVLLLLLQALFTGLFIGCYELFATLKFISSNRLPEFATVFMIAGGVGILTTAIYSYLGKQVRSSTWASLNFVVVLLLLFLTGLGYALPVIHADPAEFYLIQYVSVLPLILISLMSFRATVRGLLPSSVRKQFEGLIAVILSGGTILGHALASVLGAGAPDPDPLAPMSLLDPSSGLAPMSALVFMLLASVVQLRLVKKDTDYASRLRTLAGTAGPMRLLSHRYTAKLTLFYALGVSVMVLFLFSLLQGSWQLSANNPVEGGEPLIGDQRTLSFLLLAMFSLSLALGWLIRRFLFGHLKRMMGLRTTLLLLPVILLLLTALAQADFQTGSATWLPGAAGIWILLAGFFVSRMFKGGVLDPSMELLMRSFDQRDRENIRSGLQGVTSQVAMLMTGAVLYIFFLQNDWGSRMDYFPILVFGAVLLWILSGFELYRAYHRLLKLTLETDRAAGPESLCLESVSGMQLERSPYPVELISFNPYFFHYYEREKQLELLSHRNRGVRLLTWEHFLSSAPGVPETMINQLLGSEQDPEVLDRIRQIRRRRLVDRMDLQKAFIRERLELFNLENKDQGSAIARAFKSGKKDSIFAAVNQVALDRDHGYAPRLVELFRDRDPQMQQAAIKAAGYLERESMGMYLVDFLDHPKLFAQAWSSLVRLNGEALDELEMAFNKPEVSLKKQLRIISVLAASGGDEATRFLLQKLDYQHREVSQAVIRGLFESHYTANEVERPMIQSAILRLVEAGVWTMTAKVSIRTDSPGGNLGKVIDHELWEINELILMLLSMIYDRNSVRRIRFPLMDRTSEDRGMALELLELMLTDSLKPVLVAYFDDVLVREKFDKLKGLYPTETYPTDQVLKKILNRNAAQMGDFIRIAALDLMAKDERYYDEQQIKAQGFHPNPRIRAFAGNLLWRKQPVEYDMLTQELDFPDNQFPGRDNIVLWYMDSTMRLSEWEIFRNAGINSLFRLVSRMRSYDEQEAAAEDTVCLVRSLNAKENPDLSGGMAFIPSYEPAILEQIRYLAKIGASEAYLIDQDDFREILFDDRSLLHVFCEFLNRFEETSIPQ